MTNPNDDAHHHDHHDENKLRTQISTTKKKNTSVAIMTNFISNILALFE
jgi:hypothetical protein